MNREELIKKWLDHNLDAKEQIAFEKLEDYNNLMATNKALQAFKAPEFSAEQSLNNLKPRLTKKQQNLKNWLSPALKIAAIFIVCLSTYYFISSSNKNTKVYSEIAQQKTIVLPDNSKVNLNANSTLIYSKNSWNADREVTLNGEAFFKVEKGKQFDVITPSGIVSVLGTQFNVKERSDFFEVYCFEGAVAVNHLNNKTILSAGDSYSYIDGKHIAIKKVNTNQPHWLRGESKFKDTALKHIIKELENYYDITISTSGIDLTRRFTGSITHKNLNLALQSLTIPLNLTYTKTNNTIVLKRE